MQRRNLLGLAAATMTAAVSSRAAAQAQPVLPNVQLKTLPLVDPVPFKREGVKVARPPALPKAELSKRLAALGVAPTAKAPAAGAPQRLTPTRLVVGSSRLTLYRPLWVIVDGGEGEAYMDTVANEQRQPHGRVVLGFTAVAGKRYVVDVSAGSAGGRPLSLIWGFDVMDLYRNNPNTVAVDAGHALIAFTARSAGPMGLWLGAPQHWAFFAVDISTV
jgi:hypothetical protein